MQRREKSGATGTRRLSTENQVQAVSSSACWLPKRGESGKRVSVVKGTTGALWTKKLAPNAQILEFDTEPDTLLALKQGKVDALVNDDTILSGYKKENPDLELYGPPFYRDFLAFVIRDAALYVVFRSFPRTRSHSRPAPSRPGASRRPRGPHRP
jgi:hypothetical protein